MEKVHGTRNDYHQVNKDDYILAEGVHEGIISEELRDKAQVKVKRQSKKYEHVNKTRGTFTHLLSGIVKGPVCGVGMYGNKSIKRRPDGTRYKDFLYYGCKHRTMIRGHKCSFSKQIREELLDEAVKELYDQMNQEEKRQLLKSLIEEIHICDERQENGQWLKSIKLDFLSLKEIGTLV